MGQTSDIVSLYASLLANLMDAATLAEAKQRFEAYDIIEDDRVCGHLRAAFMVYHVARPSLAYALRSVGDTKTARTIESCQGAASLVFNAHRVGMGTRSAGVQDGAAAMAQAAGMLGKMSVVAGFGDHRGNSYVFEAAKASARTLEHARYALHEAGQPFNWRPYLDALWDVPPMRDWPEVTGLLRIGTRPSHSAGVL